MGAARPDLAAGRRLCPTTPLNWTGCWPRNCRSLLAATARALSSTRRWRSLCPRPRASAEVHHVVLTTVSRHLRIGLGLHALPPSTIEWLCLPEQKLLEWTAGRIFCDPVGEIARARRELAYLPDDVWRFKLLYAWERIGHVDVVALNALRGDTLSARLNLGKLVEGIVRIVFLLNRRYCPGTPKWVSRAFDALPRLAGEIGPQLERCLVLEDVRQGRVLLDPILAALVEEHNRLGITRPVALAAPDPIRERGLASFGLQDVEDALRESLTPELRELAVHGGCDQWVSNDDLLIWPDQYRKFGHIYCKGTPIRRDGVGDRLIQIEPGDDQAQPVAGGGANLGHDID